MNLHNTQFNRVPYTTVNTTSSNINISDQQRQENTFGISLDNLRRLNDRISNAISSHNANVPCGSALPTVSSHSEIFNDPNYRALSAADAMLTQLHSEVREAMQMTSDAAPKIQSNQRKLLFASLYNTVVEELQNLISTCTTNNPTVSLVDHMPVPNLGSKFTSVYGNSQNPMYPSTLSSSQMYKPNVSNQIYHSYYPTYGLSMPTTTLTYATVSSNNTAFQSHRYCPNPAQQTGFYQASIHQPYVSQNPVFNTPICQPPVQNPMQFQNVYNPENPVANPVVNPIQQQRFSPSLTLDKLIPKFTTPYYLWAAQVRKLLSSQGYVNLDNPVLMASVGSAILNRLPSNAALAAPTSDVESLLQFLEGYDRHRRDVFEVMGKDGKFTNKPSIHFFLKCAEIRQADSAGLSPQQVQLFAWQSMQKLFPAELRSYIAIVSQGGGMPSHDQWDTIDKLWSESLAVKKKDIKSSGAVASAQQSLDILNDPVVKLTQQLEKVINTITSKPAVTKGNSPYNITYSK